MFIRRIVASLALVALAVGACGSSAASKAPDGSAAAGATDTGKPPVVLPSMAAAGGGSCSVEIKGDATASWTDSQDMGTLLMSYWLSPAERSMLSLKDTDATFIFNCQGGDKRSLSFTLANKTTTTDFPAAPGQYQIAAGGILSGGKPGQVQVIPGLEDDNVWRTAEGGTFTVTALGNKKFTGSFQLTIQKMADNLKDVAGSATITGSFDLGCTSGACN